MTWMWGIPRTEHAPIHHLIATEKYTVQRDKCADPNASVVTCARVLLHGRLVSLWLWWWEEREVIDARRTGPRKTGELEVG